MNFTKRGIDLLLVLILLAASGVVVYFGVSNGSGLETPLPASTSTPTSTIVSTATITFTPTETLTPTLIPASAAIPTQTPTLTPIPTLTLTPSPTLTASRTPAPTAGATSTGDPVSPLSQEIKDGIGRGNQIVKAIEAYHAAAGKFPSKLTDLMPNYLTAIPLTSTGQSYFYRLFDPASPMASEVYWLEFRAVDQDHVVCLYMRRIDYWDCDYDSP